ncbi:hypothetical protein BK816_06695 [Boudabousia tangfeifanii]|uniref:Uncharacterized protein n=1 Tax=Boudabousia tangfeifanii TaxID=1912795 RepID=A0A1D9ML64_9ACTO|nr:DUF6350 family protein [Boudabousia tangfeifanii]AOZ73015.1 hypothetical protein BK816_06695 [Boudabousia tangfeifanii]
MSAEETTLSTPSKVTTVSGSAQPKLTMPHGWSRLFLAGVEVAFSSWAIVLMLVSGTYALQADNRWLSNVAWTTVLGYATQMWSAALFGGLNLPSGVMTLLPSGATLLILLQSQLALKLRKQCQMGALIFFPLGFVLSTLVIGATAGVPSLLQVCLGAGLVSFVAIVWRALSQIRAYRREQDRTLGMVGDERRKDPVLNWICNLPRDIFRGLEMGYQLLLALVAFTLVFAVVVLAVSWPRLTLVTQMLGGSGTENILLILLQLMFFPVLLAWAAAWTSGAGVYLGVGAWQSTATANLVTVPAIPVLAVFPSQTPGFWPFLWPVFFAFGIYGAWRSRRTLAQLWRVLLVSGVFFALVLALWLWTSSGSLGDGYWQQVGPRFLVAFPIIWLETWGTYALTRLIFSTTVVSWARDKRIKLSTRLRAVPVGDEPATAPVSETNEPA